MRIGELAHRAGVDVQTVRFYEQEGVLETPARTASGYRIYGPQHLGRLSFVRHCRSLDIPLADIRHLLVLASDSSVSCEDVNVLVQTHLDRIRAKRAALERLEAKLIALRGQCSSGHRIADCGILEDLIHTAQDEVRVDHFPGTRSEPSQAARRTAPSGEDY
jgi:DNA-binding transcriptional MerR regulator